ncbi:MAG: hypothetical protein ACFFGP_14870, partial [Promethearchaeota archaeon]
MWSQNSILQISRKLFFITFIIILGLFSCQNDPVNSVPDQVPEGSWMTYSPLKWTHDGKPYHANYCIVYSDGASYQTKEKVGLFADEKFTQILNLFNFQEMDDLRYPPGYDKVDVYINRYHEENIAAAYWGSIFITIRSEDENINRYNYLFRHELTHVFQFLVEGKVNLSTEVWFTEGIAIYGGGGLGGITDIEDLEQWISSNSTDPNQGNPICIQVWDDFPPGADITGYYYNVFDLTMRYFLDPIGLNKSIEDVLQLFYDLRNDVTFPVAFQSNFGLDLETLEKEYYDRMRAYLTGDNLKLIDQIVRKKNPFPGLVI